MASVIKVRTISAVTETSIQMVNSHFARLISIGTGWNKVRVGIRLHMEDTGVDAVSTPRFAMGFCSGTANQFGDATTTHFVGILSDAATWSVAPGVRYAAANMFKPAKKVGVTTTLGATAFGTVFIPAPASTANRNLMFVDITKGSPNYSFHQFATSATPTTDVSAATFLSQMELATPSLTEHTYYGPQTLAVDEGADGTLDAINFSWDRTNPYIEICDIAVAILS